MLFPRRAAAPFERIVTGLVRAETRREGAAVPRRAHRLPHIGGVVRARPVGIGEEPRLPSQLALDGPLRLLKLRSDALRRLQTQDGVRDRVRTDLDPSLGHGFGLVPGEHEVGWQARAVDLEDLEK